MSFYVESFFLFLAFIHVLYNIQILPIIFLLILIYSQIDFYTKYSVLAFSIDVVSPQLHEYGKMAVALNTSINARLQT